MGLKRLFFQFQLAKDSEDTLHIFTMNGTSMQTLELGPQNTGIYQNRSCAAYWAADMYLANTWRVASIPTPTR